MGGNNAIRSIVQNVIHGVSQDIEQAVYWYCRAAEQGDTDAKKALKRLKGK